MDKEGEDNIQENNAEIEGAEEEEELQQPSTDPMDVDKEVKDVEIAGFKSIEEYTKAGYGLIVEATKCINAFPSGPTRSLYSAYPSFNNIVENQSDRILSIISNVIHLQNVKGNIQRRDNDEKFELLLECNDAMLERINSNLDEMAGIRKMPTTVLVQTELQTSSLTFKPASGSWNENRLASSSPLKTKTTKLLTAKNIIRPQISFKTPVDNSNATPFEPRIKYKPNSLKPLAILPEYDDDGEIVSYLHPYEFELSKFEPAADTLKSVQPKLPKPIDATPLIYVDTVEKLKELGDELNGVSEFAVDVEAHSYRTFQGITCLLQISTREKDFIIDTLILRDELHLLNESFTNPKIVKIFHGADMDVEWLQRDLSVYVVNMFDTHQAAKRLGLARLSLAFLLKSYCQVDADKIYQLADWRMRPLPEELILYARQDTHYLPYIYDLMKNELLKLANGQTNLLTSVIQSSTNVCMKRYIKPRIVADSHMELYRKSKRIFDNRQLYALNEIYFWRDKIARQEDESTGYVLPNHMMLHISEILPREMQGILACCNPIPPLVRQHLNVLHQFVLRAREHPLVKIIPEEQNTNRAATLTKNRDLSSHLFCPHDLSYSEEFRDDLPTLLDAAPADDSVTTSLTTKSKLSIFDTPDNSDDDEVKEKIRKIKQIKFVSPYSRYVAILPLAEQQRREELAKKELADSKKKLCPDKIEEPEDYVIKQEPIDSKEADEANHYGLPLKELGKRKRNELKESQHNSSDVQTNKRFKTEPSEEIDIDSDIDVNDAFDSSAIEIVDDREPQTEPVREYSPFESESPQKQTTKQSNKKQSKKFKKNKRQQLRKTDQSSSKPVQFDYSQVDFKSFKGGSAKQSAGKNDVQTKFHGKNKNNRGNNNKKFEKLFKFSKGNTK